MKSDIKPFFSVIIPALNEEKFLPLLLDDLSKQSIKDFEVIVIDGKSDDKTVQKASSFNKLLPSLQILTSNIRNVSTQRNIGAKKASGHYLLFNDADNRIPTYFLEGVKYQLHVKPVDLFTCWFNPDSQETSDKHLATYMNLLIEAVYLLNRPGAYGAFIGCRKSIFSKIGGFNPEIGFAEDTEFVNRGYKKGYTFSVFHEPRYQFSFRRFRKIGKLKLIQRYAVLNLKFLTNQKVDQKKEYPMGGGYLEEEVTYSPNIAGSIRSLFSKKRKNAKTIDRIRALLSLEED